MESPLVGYWFLAFEMDVSVYVRFLTGEAVGGLRGYGEWLLVSGFVLC